MADVAVIEVVVVEVILMGIAVVKIVVTEIVVVDDRSAVGDVGIVVVYRPAAVPVVAPVVPAPSISSEKAHPESDSKSNSRSCEENPRHGIPAWIGHDRLAIDQPGVISRNVDHLGIRRLNDHRAALSRYLLLFIAAQMAGLLRL